MCNLSEGIAQVAREDREWEIIENMYRNGFSLSDIAISVEYSIEQVRDVLRERGF